MKDASEVMSGDTYLTLGQFYIMYFASINTLEPHLNENK